MHSERGRGTKIRDKDGERSEVSAGGKTTTQELGDKGKNFATDKVVLARGDARHGRPAYLGLRG